MMFSLSKTTEKILIFLIRGSCFGLTNSSRMGSGIVISCWVLVDFNHLQYLGSWLVLMFAGQSLIWYTYHKKKLAQVQIEIWLAQLENWRLNLKAGDSWHLCLPHTFLNDGGFWNQRYGYLKVCLLIGFQKGGDKKEEN